MLPRHVDLREGLGDGGPWGQDGRGLHTDSAI